MPRAIAMQRPQSIFPHQTCNPVLAAHLSAFPKILQDPRSTINSMTGSKGYADKSEKPCILLSSIRYWMIKPCVVTSAGDAEKPAHRLDAELIPMRFNKLVRSPSFTRDPV